ncbi:MAG: SpoIIE family protein phosphatase, partial [Romboutsia sp.]|nr:SpoIIE family protein phosphatase [Romboutsia sp.]
GSGFDASNIVREVCTNLWNENYKNINDEDSIREFINKIIEESNKNILKFVTDLVEDTSLLKKGIMATTFSSVIIINDEMYYITLGDSPIYLLNNNNISLLSIEDNQGNKKLNNGLSWSDYLNLEDKYYLVKYIGGDFALKYLNEDDNKIEEIIDFEIKKIRLLKDDTIILCSDGLTDYINPVSVRDDIWSNDNKLKSIILEEDISLAEINEKLVNEANKNGGGDNITIILIKVKSIEDEVQWQEN